MFLKLSIALSKKILNLFTFIEPCDIITQINEVR